MEGTEIVCVFVCVCIWMCVRMLQVCVYLRVVARSFGVR